MMRERASRIGAVIRLDAGPGRSAVTLEIRTPNGVQPR
jgi:hypothetical protein